MSTPLSANCLASSASTTTSISLTKGGDKNPAFSGLQIDERIDNYEGFTPSNLADANYEKNIGDFMKTKVKRRSTHNSSVESSSHISSSPVKSSKSLKTETSSIATVLSEDSSTLKSTPPLPRSKRRVAGTKSSARKSAKASASENLNTLLSLPTSDTSPSHTINKDVNMTSHLINNGHSPLSADPYEFQDLKFEVPPKKTKLEKFDKMDLPHACKENKSSIMKRGNSHVDENPPSYHDKETNTVTSETMTEGEFFGPCPPGTQANLNAIVWLETTGLLVVNISWRGRTYVGTLLDCTKHNYAPTNLYTYQPPYETRVSYRGRGKRRNVSYNLNGRTTRGTKGKNGGNSVPISTNGISSSHVTSSNGKANRSNATFPTNGSPLNSGAEESGDDDGLTASGASRRGGRPTVTDSPEGSICGTDVLQNGTSNSLINRPNSNNLSTNPGSAGEHSDNDDRAPYACPWPDCRFRFSKLTALRYHETHKHNPVPSGTSNSQSSVSNEDACESTNDEATLQNQTNVELPLSPSSKPVSSNSAAPATNKSLHRSKVSSLSSGIGIDESHLTSIPSGSTGTLPEDGTTSVKFSCIEASFDTSSSMTSQSLSSVTNQVQEDLHETTISLSHPTLLNTSSSKSRSSPMRESSNTAPVLTSGDISLPIVTTNVPSMPTNSLKQSNSGSLSSPHYFMNGIKLSSHNGTVPNPSNQPTSRVVSAQTVSIPMESSLMQSSCRLPGTNCLSNPMSSTDNPSTACNYSTSKFTTALSSSTVALVPGTNVCPPLQSFGAINISSANSISKVTTPSEAIPLASVSQTQSHIPSESHLKTLPPNSQSMGTLTHPAHSSLSLSTPTKKRKRSPSRHPGPMENTLSSFVVKSHCLTEPSSISGINSKSNVLPETVGFKDLSMSSHLSDFTGKVVVTSLNSFPVMSVSVTPDTSSCNAPPSPAYSDISDPAPVLEKEEDFKSPGTCGDRNGGSLPYPPPSLVPAISTTCVDLSHRNRDMNVESNNATTLPHSHQLSPSLSTNSKTPSDSQEMKMSTSLSFESISNNLLSGGNSSSLTNKGQIPTNLSHREISDDLDGRISLFNSIISAAAIHQQPSLVSTLANTITGLHASMPVNSSSGVKLNANSSTVQSHSSSVNPFAQFPGASTAINPGLSNVQLPTALSGISPSSPSTLTHQKLFEILTQHIGSMNPSTNTTPLHHLSGISANNNPIASVNMMGNTSSPGFTIYPTNGLHQPNSLTGGYIFSPNVNNSATNSALVNAIQQRAMFQQHK